MEIHEDFINAISAAYLQPDRQDRNSANGHETLGELVRERTQSRSMAGCQQKRFHGFTLVGASNAGEALQPNPAGALSRRTKEDSKTGEKPEWQRVPVGRGS
jgi:hypothetical protein